ncbi:MAG: amidohydrolase family protein [Streptosporangiales bacterium]
MSAPPDIAPVTDALAYLGTSRYGGSQDWPTLSAQARAMGITRVVCAPAMPADRDLGSANERLIDRAVRPAENDVELVALARVDPWEPGAAGLADGTLTAGSAGLFLHPWEETYAVTRTDVLAPLMSVAERHGVPVVVEAGFPWLAEPAQVGRLASCFPAVPIVATRGGHMNMSGLSGDVALRALRQNPNLYVTTSGVYRRDWLGSAIAEVGSSRFLYASLAPTLDARLELARARALHLPAAAMTQVLRENAAELFSRTPYR